MLDKKIIESALALTGKTIKDMEEYEENEIVGIFSIEKFSYYLLSPEFIKEYTKDKDINWLECSELFGRAIFEYQSGMLEAPLIQLLSKIGKSNI